MCIKNAACIVFLLYLDDVSNAIWTGILVKGWRIIVRMRRMKKEGIDKILFKNKI